MAQASLRPRGVTAVVVLILIAAVLDIGSGILQILTGEGKAIAWLSGGLTLVIAVVYLLLARGIAEGRQVARLIVAVATSLMVVVTIWSMFMQPHLWPALILQVLVNVTVLALLYTEAANEFFARPPVAAGTGQ